MKLATGQRDGLIKDVASLEKEVAKLDGDATTLKLLLEKSKDQHNDNIATLKSSIADREARAADGSLAKAEELKKAKKEAEKEHRAAMQQAEQKLAGLTRDLDKLSVQASRDADKSDNRIKELDRLLSAAIAEKQDLAAENAKIQAAVGDAGDNEQALLRRIEELESQLLEALSLIHI